MVKETQKYFQNNLVVAYLKNGRIIAMEKVKNHFSGNLDFIINLYNNIVDYRDDNPGEKMFMSKDQLNNYLKENNIKFSFE
jgi:hypothetical protein